MKHENKVILIGDVVHVFKRPRFAIVTIRTVYGSRVPNYPQVKIYGELADKIYEGMIGERVEVEGYCITEKEQRKKEVDIIATSLEFSDKRSLNEVHISGYIVKINENIKDTVQIVIKTIHGKYRNTIETFLYTKDVKAILEEYNVGDKVSVYGNIQTKKRVYPDVTKYYKDITLREIEKIVEE